MDVSFANPAGLWALLGVPAVLLIHLLQRQSRFVTASTLFLLDQLTPLSAQGRRIERLRNSIPLWLQILAVLLVTWVLARPTWLRKDSSQTVAVVLDSSVSMRAFREETLAALRTRLPEIAKAAAHTQWILLESDPAQPTLYAGRRLEELLNAVTKWQPRLGTHDPAEALRVARSLLRERGVALFVSDHAADLPDGVELLAVGRPLENCGFAGARVEEAGWTALVTNHGTTPQTREWWVEAGDAATARRAISLRPGETIALRGAFPEGADRCTLVLTGDGFALDDRLPIVREQRKSLRIAVKAATPFFERFAETVQDASVVTEGADVVLASYEPLAPSAVPPHAIVGLHEPNPEADFRSGPIVAENDPLTDELSWQGLIVRKGIGIPVRESDDVLLWQGGAPLVFVRTMEGGRSLILNFDIAASNADRIPAFVVMLHRFVESLRADKVAPERRNVDANQRLNVAGRAEESPPYLVGAPDAVLRAPAEPQFFDVVQGSTNLLAGAAQFSDVREADFRSAISADRVADRIEQESARHRRGDLLTPVWVLLLGSVCLANWAFTHRSRVS